MAILVKCCLVVELGLGLVLDCVRVVSGYEHVSILLSVVIVTLPETQVFCVFFAHATYYFVTIHRRMHAGFT